MQISSGLDRQNKRVPFTLANAMVSMFSDNHEERAFMIRLWYEIEEASQSEIYSTDLIDDPEKPNGPQIFDGNGKYPLYYGEKGIPIQLPSRYAAYLGGNLKGWSTVLDIDFQWTDDQLRRALLALRAVSPLPL